MAMMIMWVILGIVAICFLWVLKGMMIYILIAGLIGLAIVFFLKRKKKKNLQGGGTGVTIVNVPQQEEGMQRTRFFD